MLGQGKRRIKERGVRRNNAISRVNEKVGSRRY
jgi:hypothetical protein